MSGINGFARSPQRHRRHDRGVQRQDRGGCDHPARQPMPFGQMQRERAHC